MIDLFKKYLCDFTGSLRPLFAITNMVFAVENDNFVLFTAKVGPKMGREEIPARAASSHADDAGQNAARFYAVNGQLYPFFSSDF